MMRARLLAPLLFLSLTTCGDGTGPAASRVHHIEITGRLGLRVGENVRFDAEAFDAGGAELSTLHLEWRTSDSAVAIVNGHGLVSTLATGTVTITAMLEGVEGQAVVTVTPRPLKWVTVTPEIHALMPGDSVRLAAVVRDSGGTIVNRPVTWTTSDTGRAQVSAGGMVRARRDGRVAIRAHVDTLAGGAFLTVLLPVSRIELPESIVTTARTDPVLLVPAAFDSTGTQATTPPLQWSTRNPAVASVSTAGVVTGQDSGTTWIVAETEVFSDSTFVRILEEPVRTMSINLTTTGTDFGTVGRLQASLSGPSGQPVQWPVSWLSRDTSVMRLTPDPGYAADATVSFLRPGLGWILITSQGVTDSTPILVTRPISQLVIQPDTIRLRPGLNMTLHPTLQDSDRYVKVDPAPVTWSTNDSTAIAFENTVPQRVRGLRVDTALVIGIAVSGGVTYRDTVVVLVQPSSLPRLTWQFSGTGVFLSATGNAAITLTDSAGVVPATGSDVRIESSDTSIASVTTSLIPALRGSQTVGVVGKRAGTVFITARTDSVESTMWVRVLGDAVQSIDVDYPSSIVAGDSATLSVTTFPGIGCCPDPYRGPVTWSSLDSTVAFVAGNRVLRTFQPGRALITARGGVAWDTFTVVVRSATGPVVGSMSAPILYADSVVQVTGSGFDAIAANNSVRVAGLPATVLSATPTSVSLRLPPASAFTCAPVRSVQLTFAVPGALSVATAPFAVASQFPLATGVPTTMAGSLSSPFCGEIAATGDYLVAVRRDAPPVASPVGFRMLGTGSGTIVPFAPAAPAIPQPGSTVAPEPIRRPRSSHQEILESSRELMRDAGSPVPLLAGRLPLMRLGAADSAGGLYSFRVPRVTRTDFCASYHTVLARRAYASAHLAIYEDVSNQLGGSPMDPVYGQLATEFENAMLPKITANFGNPLALDAMLDGDGRIAVLVTNRVNLIAAGFVVSCDFYPESVARSTNLGETIYLPSPTSAPPGFPNGIAGYWRWQARATLMHETKHIASYAERIAAGHPPEDPWLEEGSAVIAEELWARVLYGIQWKSNATYQQSLFCDVRIHLVTVCNDAPFAMVNAFAFLHDYAGGHAGGPASHSPLGSTSANDATFYGSAWSLLRWAIDHYAPDEGAFLRALTQSPVTGSANLEARTGRPIAGLTTDWLMATFLDDDPSMPAVGGVYSQPSWNMRDIFAGMATDFQGSFVSRPFVAGTAGTGSFVRDVPDIRGGGIALTRVSGANAGWLLLRFQGPLGSGPASSDLGVRILRLQ